MNYKQVFKQEYDTIYKELYLIYNRHRLNTFLRLPREDDYTLKLTIIDYTTLLSMFLFISGLTATLLGRQHITMLITIFLSICLVFFSGISIFMDYVNK